MKKLLNKIKAHLSKHLSKKDIQSDKQRIVIPLTEKIINPITDHTVINEKEHRSTVIHKVILSLNEKLNVFGVGEVTSYELNSKGELVMNLSYYEQGKPQPFR